LWKSRTQGGVASVEVTNIGNGWHPHLHAVIDCQWLAWKTPMPYPSMPRAKKKILYQQAGAELSASWAKLLGQATASVKVKRASRSTIAKEVMKYTVKNEDLVMCEGSAGDLIRALEGTRLVTTFGILHGQKSSEIKVEARAYAKAKRAKFFEENPMPECCGAVEYLPDEAANIVLKYAPRCEPAKIESKP
jgi:hypothetical protein